MSELTTALGKSPQLTVADNTVREHASKYVVGDLADRLRQEDPWASLSMLWPPRLIEAVAQRKLVAFFGAGMSLAAGAPSWSDLLAKHFRLGDDLLQDRELGDDPLTLAQLAAEHVGYERVQQTLREVMSSYSQPTTAHILLAALRFPFYITTNYDALFESAWSAVFPKRPLAAVIVNDLDLSGGIDIPAIVKSEGSILLKIHGCVRRDKEQLILTRRDYRTHYRSNERFFEQVRKLLHDYHVLFLGFSHRDPEVSRLVEDVIYSYERDVRNAVTPASLPPHFYSLQFDMRSHSPEVFAARGIVALKPPLVPATIADVRSTALATALCDLDAAASYKLHKKASLDALMRECLDRLAADINRALGHLSGFARRAINAAKEMEGTSWMQEAVTMLEQMAGQGVWLVNEEGIVVDYFLPPGLSKKARDKVLTERAQQAKRPPPPNGLGWLDDRPYFRSAKTFQEPFLSDVSSSIFNKHGTIFLCHPLIDEDGQFRGVLFAATQAGAWSTPVELAERCLREERQFLLVDSNGVLVVPTVGDHMKRIVPIESSGAGGVEESAANIGFPYSRLLDLSRRDALVAHVANNIVPVSQDDDIMVLSVDLKQYSVIAELPHSRLKLAVTRGIR